MEFGIMSGTLKIKTIDSYVAKYNPEKLCYYLYFMLLCDVNCV